MFKKYLVGNNFCKLTMLPKLICIVYQAALCNCTQTFDKVVFPYGDNFVLMIFIYNIYLYLLYLYFLHYLCLKKFTIDYV